jgi:hypothetical protein
MSVPTTSVTTTTASRIAVSLGLTDSDLFQQALVSLLREKERQVLRHRLDILARYDAGDDVVKIEVRWGEVDASIYY